VGPLLDGRRGLVVGGGGGGIGRAITRAFAAAGSAVVVVDIERARAEEAAAEAGATGVQAAALVADVRSSEDIDAVVTGAAQELGGLDVLVTVVGGQLAFVPAARVHEIADEDWELMFELNLRYVARAVRAAVGLFIEQGTGGSIVSVGSITGVAGSPGQAAYGAAKAGLASLARSVAAEYGRAGIRMNVVAAGPIATPVAQAAQAQAELDWIPLGRAGSPEEVANAAVFLASPLASYISGQTLIVDGGATAVGPFPVEKARGERAEWAP
jgi:3-oxoacyl-[acyl-carrier protein] reductase